MSKYSFLDDYSEGCHPSILTALTNTNTIQQTAYGNDDYSTKAKELIKQQLHNDHSDVYFVSGGTLANIIIMASSLRPHEAIIAPETGHITVRETGAIEATGHKIITVPPVNGKLTVAGIEKALEDNAHFPHMARPRLVYISNATEIGTIYSKAELEALSRLCKANNLLLLVDGARLGAALSANNSDVTLADVARLTDIFWIGGTKSGALFGEAIVINNPALQDDFAFHIKQRGALLAKGRVLGLQFQTLFETGLFADASQYANQLAQQLSDGIQAAGFSLSAPTETNQVFAILPNSVINALQQQFDFYIWNKVDDHHCVIRLVTSWATDKQQVDHFIQHVNKK